MSEAKHTPGPWKVDDCHAIIVWAGNMRICDIRGWGHLTGIGGMRLSDEEAAAIQDANARLIAAAPEMLEALKSVESFTADELGTRKNSFLPNPTGEESEYLQEAEDALNTVRAAIAKAEGRQ